MAKTTITVTTHGKGGYQVTAEACIAGRKRRKSACAFAVGSTAKVAKRLAVAAVAKKL